MKPTIAITMGDPTGVGPEVILKAISDKNITRLCNPVILGDEAVLKYLISNLKSQILIKISRGSAILLFSGMRQSLNI